MPAWAASWFYPLAFFGLGLAHAGVRLGRKTYMVDMAEGNRRTDYVAVSNSVIGALLLVSGVIGGVAAGLVGSVLSLLTLPGVWTMPQNLQHAAAFLLHRLQQRARLEEFAREEHVLETGQFLERSLQ